MAEGRLSLSAVVLLTPYLSEATADELLAGATHKSKAELEQLLAERFPRPDLPTQVNAIPSALPPCQLAPEPVGTPAEQYAPAQIEARRPKVAPLSPERFALQLTMGQSTHDKLRYAQTLLGHQVPSGDLVQVLDRALDALILTLEKRKFAATARPRPPRQCSATRGRHIPAAVKRAVWERDKGQCTFVSEAGHRCPASTRLEFDHIDAVARGGRASVPRLRLRCRAHNQYEAERVFGAGFMREKREARRAAAAARAATTVAAAREQAAAGARADAAAAAEQAQERDVVPWLRQLRFSADEAGRAAAYCESIPDAPLEERMRAALYFLRPRAASRSASPTPRALGTAA